MRSNLAIVTLFLCVGLSVHAEEIPADSARAPASPEQWAAALEDPATSSEQRATALAALAATATGPLSTPETRPASFALAEYAAASGAEMTPARRVRAIESAVSLFPDDPRAVELLPRLARLQAEIGDVFGAHLAYQRLLQGSVGDAPSDLLSAAAHNAAVVGDFASALEWSSRVDAATVDAAAAFDLESARLLAGEALGRYDVAVEAAARLEGLDAERFHLADRSILAAARAHERSGLVGQAIAFYVAYVNIFADRGEQPEALLALGRLLIQVGDLDRARRFLDWLRDEHPDTAAASRAGIELLEMDSADDAAADLDGYLALLAGAPDLGSARLVARRLAERWLERGRPLDLFSALSALAAEDDGETLSPLVARETLQASLESILIALEARRDQLGIAAVSARAAELKLPLPAGWRDSITESRARIGLDPVVRGLFEEALEQAAQQMREGQWSDAAKLLHQALQSVTDPHPATAIRATRMLAEASWRADDDRAALRTIDQATRLFRLEPADERAFEVLRADILFGKGLLDDACAAYRRAAALGPSRWVEMQLDRCRKGELPPRREGAQG